MHALLACLLISAAYVAPFYFQRRLARSHSRTIIFRTLSTFAVCLVAWLPLTLTISRALQVSVTTICWAVVFWSNVMDRRIGRGP